jgi:hypothetical protein
MSKASQWLRNSALALGSVCFTLVSTELVLRAIPSLPSISSTQIPTREFGDDIPSELVSRAQARHGFVTMPDKWKIRPAQVQGAWSAHWWHGILSVSDRAGMRRTEPFPPKQPGTYRVMVVGDSLTYGYGIEEKDTFVALLNTWMSDRHMEFLNLGVPGAQSEDVLAVIRQFLPTLQPDFVLYAVCLNDFLPSGREQYSEAAAYAFPLPENWKQYLLSNFRFA